MSLEDAIERELAITRSEICRAAEMREAAEALGARARVRLARLERVDDELFGVKPVEPSWLDEVVAEALRAAVGDRER
jgi:hypothetical protein